MGSSFNSQTLANGLKLVTRNVDTELFHFEVAVPFGMDDELSPPTYESAHALEHMVAKFTSEKYPDSVLNSEMLDSLGIAKNAYTTPQCTGYYINGLGDAFPAAFDVVLHALASFKFDDSVFVNEMKAVVNELRAHITDAWHDFYSVTDAQLFAGTARAKSTQQRLQNVANLTKPQLLATFREHYQAQYMTVIYAGPRRHISALAANLSLIKNSDASRQVRRPVPAPRIGFTVHIPQTLKNDAGRVQCSFRVNTKWTPRLHAIATCAATTLTQGFSSRLYRTLRTQRGLIYAVHSRLEFEVARPEYSYFHIVAKCTASSIPAVWDCIRHEVTKLALAGPTACEMRKWRNQRRTVLAALAHLSPKELVQQCGWIVHQGHEPVAPNDIAEDALKLTEEELKNFAQQYLKVENCIVFHNGNVAPAPAAAQPSTSSEAPVLVRFM